MRIFEWAFKFMINIIIIGLMTMRSKPASDVVFAQSHSNHNTYIWIFNRNQYRRLRSNRMYSRNAVVCWVCNMNAPGMMATTTSYIRLNNRVSNGALLHRNDDRIPHWFICNCKSFSKQTRVRSAVLYMTLSPKDG